MGYLRRITEEDLPLLPPGYNADVDRVGAVGIEGEFEELLRGRKGQRVVEEDVVGREIRVVDEPQSAAPGNNLHLTLDLDLQQFAQQALQDEIDEINRYYDRTKTRRGVAMVMNVKTGEILAMVSLPTYDNNIFSKSAIKQEELDAISNDPYLPQLNHAFQSAFAPGSVFKVVPASAGLAGRRHHAQDHHLRSGRAGAAERIFPGQCQPGAEILRLVPAGLWRSERGRCAGAFHQCVLL